LDSQLALSNQKLFLAIAVPVVMQSLVKKESIRQISFVDKITFKNKGIVAGGAILLHDVDDDGVWWIR
jgi:hypothetical protein